mmetsp:Transcript_5501/g.9081  ORF Transcript_5501/g.9081 Transcript_5501/m.9081 type:complete len:236 (-) Transcript_5501:82-789(-)
MSISSPNSNTAVVVFVIAHPDDESMFLVPTICALKATKKWIICLSNGNHDGLGKEREIELHRVAVGCLGVDRVIIVNHKDLQDSPTGRWSKDVIRKVLDEHLPRDDEGDGHVEIYTFDKGGVSGHINHVDTYLGVQHYLRHNQAAVKVFQLITVTSILQKYVPIWHWFVLFLSFLGFARPAYCNASTTTLHYTLYQPWINWKCMAGHTSQFVWYRRLFVVFSCYTYENKWKLMQA